MVSPDGHSMAEIASDPRRNVSPVEKSRAKVSTTERPGSGLIRRKTSTSGRVSADRSVRDERG